MTKSNKTKKTNHYPEIEDWATRTPLKTVMNFRQISSLFQKYIRLVVQECCVRYPAITRLTEIRYPAETS
jgi:hypothetical protein